MMKVAIMTRKLIFILIILILPFLVVSVLMNINWFDAQPIMIKPADNVLYLDPNQPIKVRVADLLSYMTLEEKIGQMTLVEKNSIQKQSDIAEYFLGAMLSGSGSKPEQNTIEGWRKMISSFQAEAQKTRLGIPLLYGADAIHGHAQVLGATVFPHSINLGASHNPELVRKVAQATAQELAVAGVNWSFSPNLDQPKDIRWGRVYEAFSDDPKLVSSLGVAYLQGLQESVQTGDSDIFVLATPKHYLGLGGMGWKTSLNKNFKIDQGITEADETLLRSHYLPPFASAVDAGALSIMVGLNTWGDKRMVLQKYLLTKVLKQELEFKGFIVSDWYGVHEGRRNIFWSTVSAINAGVDMVMLPFDYKTFTRHMKWANRLGLVSDERINEAVGRILYAKFALGLFDAKEIAFVPPMISQNKHRALAREAVAQSLVLLKNNYQVLPIKPSVRHIRVAGSATDNVGQQTGAWTVEWQGIDGNWLPKSTSILEGIRELSSSGTQIEFNKYGIFSSEQIADIGIAIVGEKPYAEGWGDTEFPILSLEDRVAIQNLREKSRQLVVIIVSGRPLLIENEIEDIDALVVAWLPGSEGGGIADVLFGYKSFTGTLPVPWPLRSEQLPIGANDTTADNTTVLFQRYFGLTY